MTNQDVGQSRSGDGSDGDSPDGPETSGSIVLGTVTGIAVASAWPAHPAEYIANLIVGAIAGALIAIMNERMKVPKFNWVCFVIIIGSGIFWFLMPSVQVCY